MIKDLRLVELELFSYCNRKCRWCPNSNIDRKSKTEWLNYDVISALLQELKDNAFTGKFSFSRYNEPFAYFDALQQACMIIKQKFPDAVLVSNTNGDFITEQIIKEMQIDELTIMDYDYKGRDFALAKLQEWHVSDITEYGHYFVGKYENKKVLYYYSWLETANISDRGGNLTEYSKIKREVPCFEPLYFIGVNYDGTVSPCCNVRNDCEKQKDFILGDLKESTLSEILSSDKYKDFVRHVTSADFTSDMPCYYCNNGGGRYTREKGGILY